MSWHHTGHRTHSLGRESAVPLGGNRHRPLSHSVTVHRRSNTSMRIAMSKPRPAMNHDEFKEARRLHQENVERANRAAKRNLDRQAVEYANRTRGRSDDRKQVNDKLQERRPVPRSPPVCPQMNTPWPRKRPSPPTRVASKRTKADSTSPIVVWAEDASHESCLRETLTDRALKEGCTVPKSMDMNLIKKSVMDGLAIIGSADGTTFRTGGLSSDPATKTATWKGLVSGLELSVCGNNQLQIVSNGDNWCDKIGQGTFNIVLSFHATDVLPNIPSGSAWRVTRPDKDICGNYKYQNIHATVAEIHNALFASMNNVGVAVHGVAAFEFVHTGRSMRYGLVIAMKRASSDLTRSLDAMRTEKEGMEAAEKIIDLLYAASRMGVAFTDIKPGNILEFKTESGSFYRLTDYDPSFFIVTNKDWRSLLLLNLALLSAHVFAADFRVVGVGWAKAVGPLLRQLVRNKHLYDSNWIFNARCVDVHFRQPRNFSDYELQRNLSAMWYSYFVEKCELGSRASTYEWVQRSENTREYHAHLGRATDCRSWPASWSAPNEQSLIKQLVDFSLQPISNF